VHGYHSLPREEYGIYGVLFRVRNYVEAMEASLREYLTSHSTRPFTLSGHALSTSGQIFQTALESSRIRLDSDGWLFQVAKRCRLLDLDRN